LHKPLLRAHLPFLHEAEARMSNQEEWAHQLMLEREREAIEALQRCAKAGADPEAIKTLARECGINPKHITVGNDEPIQSN
jgi:hypothetical protein